MLPFTSHRNNIALNNRTLVTLLFMIVLMNESLNENINTLTLISIGIYKINENSVWFSVPIYSPMNLTRASSRFKTNLFYKRNMYGKRMWNAFKHRLDFNVGTAFVIIFDWSISYVIICLIFRVVSHIIQTTRSGFARMQ